MKSNYKHGIEIKEQATNVSIPASNQSEVAVIFGTAPVNLANDPMNATNKLFLCNSMAEAKAAVGYSDDYNSYTLCQAMDAFFGVYGVAPVVVCNVLDPNTHNKAYTETLAVIDGQAKTTKKGILTNGLTVKHNEAGLTEGTDYITEFNSDGYLVITVLKESVDSIVLTGKQLDPSAVTASDIVGSIGEDGTLKGLELVKHVFHKFGLVPGMLLAPSWSKEATVGLALNAKCEEVSGVFKCVAIVDIDTVTATTAEKALEAKASAGFNGKNTICVWPMVKVGGKVMAYSALYAAMTVNTDRETGNVPSVSASNKALPISAAVTEAGAEVILEIDEANDLNAQGIVTAISFKGFRSWGNNMASYPAATDPKDRWIPCRRFFNWVGNSFIVNYFDNVDDPTNYRLIQSVVDAENVRGNQLTTDGRCAGMVIEFDETENPVEQIMNGKIVFHERIAPYTPAEYWVNEIEFDPTMLMAALSGGEE